jgi:hypothetical protein
MSEDFYTLLEICADDAQWAQWEREASKLELPVDYYVAEFILEEQTTGGV